MILIEIDLWKSDNYDMLILKLQKWIISIVRDFNEIGQHHF